MDSIVECVPNISEGRDIAKIERIVDAARNIVGCAVLGVEPDKDYNRTVITIAGEPQSVQQAAHELILKAIEEIDMTTHSGEHPRLGAVDVCPFVPLEGVTMDECVELARSLAERVASSAQVPVFVYGEAAFNTEKALLSTIRKGEYEGLEERLSKGASSHPDSTRYPDFGPNEWNSNAARSGGITIGARGILVAYNVNVMEKDAHVSKKIGSLVRSSGRLIKHQDGRKMRIPGMLTMVQGMGVTLEAHSMSQVSMNLRDVNKCPMHVAFETCKSIASDHGVEVIGSELVGLVPLQAMLVAGQWYANEGESDEFRLVDAAIEGLGLRQIDDFVPEQRIIEWAVKKAVGQ